MSYLRLCTTTLFLFATAALFAGQAADTPARVDRAQERLQELKERLQLTPEQSERVREILTTEMERLKAVQEKYKDEGQSRRGRRKMARELRDVQNSGNEKLRTILSKEQMEELEKIRAERRQEFRERAKRR